MIYGPMIRKFGFGGRFSVLTKSAIKCVIIPALMLAGVLAPVAGVWAKTPIPCEVTVKFEDDPEGVATIYRLRLQYKNTTARPITHISVLTFDGDGNEVGNSDADCRKEGKGLDAGQTGQCLNDLQIITGRMANRLTFQDWLAMIRDQQDKLTSVTRCKVVGARYQAD